MMPNWTRKAWYRNHKLWRYSVMAFFFLFLLRVAYHHNVKGGGPRGEPSVEAYCPFGGIENLYHFLTTGGYIRRIEPSAMILLAAVVLLTLVASRGFCGWVCPFGSLQEWIGLAGKKIFGKKFNPTGPWDRRLRYLKYVVLAVIVGLTWYTGTLVFRDYDPFLAFFHLGEGISERPWAYAALAVVLLGSLLIDRFFCKYACPLGAVLGLLGKIGLTRVRRDPSECKACNVCRQKCYAHIDVASFVEIRHAECNHCLDCVAHCPKPNVLRMRGPRWRFSHPVYALVLVAGLFVMIGASKLAGQWRTKPQTVSLRDSAGRLDPEAIRGWMTLEEISTGYGIPLEELYRRTGLPGTVPAAAPLNRIAGEYDVEFSPEVVREVVRSFLARDQAPKSKAAIGAAGDEPEIRGYMTLDEVVRKTGVPKDYLLKRLGLPATIDGRLPLRDWVHDHNTSVPQIREAVREYRASKPAPQPGASPQR